MAIAPELIERFRADLAAVWPALESDEARLGIAVSGGGDSMALLLLAQAALPDRIEAATVDHRLRSESAGEAAIVARHCGQLGVPHSILAVDVPQGNMQARAREARYAALAAWCRDKSLDALATAHQLDDQAETLLMRLNRGSGLGGLSAIRARGLVPLSAIPLVRPLLGWRREDLRALVVDAGIDPVDDPSNENSDFDRIRVRKALADAEWLDPAGLARSAALLGEAGATIDRIVAREYAEHVELSDGRAVYFAARSGLDGTLVQSGVVCTIFRHFGKAIGRGEAAALAAALKRGGKRNVGGILAECRQVAGVDVWAFAAEPPRRSA